MWVLYPQQSAHLQTTYHGTVWQTQALDFDLQHHYSPFVTHHLTSRERFLHVC
jgi:hypothetical protein